MKQILIQIVLSIQNMAIRKEKLGNIYICQHNKQIEPKNSNKFNLAPSISQQDSSQFKKREKAQQNNFKKRNNQAMSKSGEQSQHHEQQQQIVQQNDAVNDENNQYQEGEEQEIAAVEQKQQKQQGQMMMMQVENQNNQGRIDIERLGYQQQQQQNDPPVQQQQQQEQGQLHESNHSSLPQQQPHLNDSYINKLQTHLNKVKAELSTKQQQYDSLVQENKKTRQTLKKLRFDFLSSKQQLSSLNQNKAQLQKLNQSLQSTNTHLQQQLKTYKQAGDINYYKNKIIQLQKLLEVQNKQLKMKTVMVDEKDERGLGRGRVDVLGLLDKYERENVLLNKKHADIMSINAQLQDLNKANQLIITQLKLTISQNTQALAIEKQKSLQLQEDLKNNEQDFQKKIKQLEESLQQIMANQENKNNGHQLIDNISSKIILKSPQELYGIKILAPLEERNLIMREYIQLEIKHQSLTQELTNLRERHYNTLRQVKNIAATHVPKKDFSELYKKYVKLRKCLENSLINEQYLRKQLLKFSGEGIPQENNSNGQSKGEAESQAFSKYKTLVLEQPQNEINKIDKIIQKTNESQKQLFTLKQQLETKQKLIRNEKLLKQKDEKIVCLEKQCQKFKNLIKLYDTELTFKNNEIVMLRRAHQQGIEKIFHLQKNLITKDQQHQLKALIEQKQMTNDILQIKNIQALRENAILKTQKQNLTELYNDLKSMYEEIINKEPQLQLQQNKPHYQKQGQMMEIQHKSCKQCLQRQQKLKSLTFSQVETQTQGLSQIYFKQIKQLLTVLRKFPKKVDSITSLLQGEKSTIHEVKKRYDQVTQAYGVKYRQLDEEKKANDQWRLKQKDEIREEFQQIRELLLNERLITALRKAKSLIEFYEQNAPEAQGDQNPQDGEEEEGNQKPKQNGEQPIEEEKQNP